MVVLICGCVFVWVCVRISFVMWVVCMCGFFDNCAAVLVISLFVFTLFCIVCTLFLYCFFYVYLFSFFTSVMVTSTE